MAVRWKRAPLARVVATVVCICASTAVAAGCGDSSKSSSTGTDGSTSQSGNVAFFTALGNTYLGATQEGLESALAEEGVEVTAFDSKFDATTQLNQIQDAIVSQKFDAFVIYPVNGTIIAPAVKRAADAGIKVVATDYPLGQRFDTTEPQEDGVLGAVLLPATTMGTQLGEVTVKACAGKSPCEVAQIPGIINTPYEGAVYDAFKTVLNAHPDIEIVARQEGKLLADPAYGVTQNLLQAHPSLDVIASTGDQMATGAEKAVKAAGKTGEVAIIGEGTSVPGVKAVKEGRWFASVTDLPRTAGEIAGAMTLQALGGEPVDPDGLNPVEQADLPGSFSKSTMKQFPADFVGEWKG